MVNKLVIANQTRGLHYGIGTYLTNLLKDTEQVHLVVVKSPKCVQKKQVNLPPHQFVLNGNELLGTLERFDIIHFNFFHDELFLQNCKREGCKTVATLHHLDEIQINKVFFEALDGIICPSEHTKQYLIQVGMNPHKARVIYHGTEDCYNPESRHCKLKEQFSIQENEMLILFAGRCDKKKGIRELAHAWELIKQRNQSCRLIIAGGGNPSPYFTSQERVILTGYLDKESLMGLYSLAEIGIIPSYSETFGYVAVEMMMQELPIIFSNTSGLNEIIDHQVNGIKIPLLSKDGEYKPSYKQLATSILSLLEHKQQSKQLGKNGRDKFLKCFQSSLMKKNTEAFYQKIIAKN